MPGLAFFIWKFIQPSIWLILSEKLDIRGSSQRIMEHLIVIQARIHRSPRLSRELPTDMLWAIIVTGGTEGYLSFCPTVFSFSAFDVDGVASLVSRFECFSPVVEDPSAGPRWFFRSTRMCVWECDCVRFPRKRTWINDPWITCTPANNISSKTSMIALMSDRCM